MGMQKVQTGGQNVTKATLRFEMKRLDHVDMVG